MGGSARRNKCVLLVIFDPTDAKYPPDILRTFNIRKPGKGDVSTGDAELIHNIKNIFALSPSIRHELGLLEWRIGFG